MFMRPIPAVVGMDLRVRLGGVLRVGAGGGITRRHGETEGRRGERAHAEARRRGEGRTEVSGLAVDPVLGQVKEGGEWFGDGSGEWEAMP